MSTNQLLGIALAACAVVVVVAVVGTRFLTKEPPPPPPPPPPAPEASVTGLLRYNDGYYKATLEESVKRWHLDAAQANPARLSEPFVYADELSAPKNMKVEKDALDTAHLHLTTRVMKEWAQTETGQRYRYEHTVLGVTNKTDKYLAYRVETAVDHPEKCMTKGALAQNAVALAPGESIERTECLWRPHATVMVKRIEVMELPLVSYYFVSRLPPAQVLLDERAAAGHEFAKAKACQFVPWREIQVAAKERGTRWVDVMDFYARHDCDEYSFWPGYTRWLAPGKLPARPVKLAAVPPK
jgi:hypothetical protein